VGEGFLAATETALLIVGRGAALVREAWESQGEGECLAVGSLLVSLVQALLQAVAGSLVSGEGR
jgi:hypothetical protein